MMRLFSALAPVRRQIIISGAVGCMAAVIVAVPSAEAQTAQYASKQRSAAAAGYYARARAMLVEALEEFEQGRKYARPDLVLDSEEWRLTLISLTEELNRLVDPKVRVTRDGVRFSANPRMVRRERDRLPPVPDGAQDRNTYGEERRMKDLQESRSKLYDVVDEAPANAEEQAAPPSAGTEDAEAASRATLEQAVENAVENAVEQNGVSEQHKEALGLEGGETEETSRALEGTETEEENLNEGAKEQPETEQVSSAIEDAIKERLKSLEVGSEQDPAASNSGSEEAETEEGSQGSEDVEQPEE